MHLQYQGKKVRPADDRKYNQRKDTLHRLSLCDTVFFRKTFTCLYLSQNYETNLQNIQTNITGTQITQKDTQIEEGFN